MILGALVALALPIVYSVGAVLVSSGIVPAERSGVIFEMTMSLQLNALAGIVLLFSGIAMVGRAARLQSGWAWLVLIVVAFPVGVVLWFIAYATLGGTLGSPF